MTQQLFNEWLLAWDQRLIVKVTLVLDNYPAYSLSIQSQLVMITLVFLPHKTNSLLQPLDKEIIHSFKAKYRKKILKFLFMEDERNDKEAGYTEEKVTIKRAIICAKISWEEVEAKTIKSCLSKTGLFDDFRFDILRNVFHENLEVKHNRDVLIEHFDNIEGFDNMNP